MLDVGRRLGPYEIIAPIGAGGMGEVYKARDTRLERLVALKVLPPGVVNAAQAARFLREARTASSLNHPNICTVYDAGQADDLPYIAMEFCAGSNLHYRLEHGPLPILEMLDIACALADALATAHEQGIIHRDIKPANVMLTARGPKLLDFGLAKPAGPADPAEKTAQLLTALGTTVGTVPYMAPEQVRGTPLDARADLFSLGIVLYEMVTGVRPFQGETAGAISAAILTEQPASPRSLRPDIPPALEATILKALEKDRALRHQTVADLRIDLERVKRDLTPSGTSVVDRPSGTAIAAARGPKPLVMMAMLAVLALGAAGAFWLWRSGRLELASTPLAEFTMRELTFTGNARQPSISPDGKYVAYVQQDGNEFSLWVRQVETPSNVRVVPADHLAGHILATTVTADGNFVDFVRGPTPLQTTLWRAALLGGPATKILDRVASPVGWSSDGRRFAFVRSDMEQGVFSLVVANADGSQANEVATRKVPSHFNTLAQGVATAPAWSADDQLMAVAAHDAEKGRPQVAIINLAERSQMAIDVEEDLSGVAWLNARSLVIAAGDQLWHLSYPAGKRTRLTNDVNTYTGVSIAHDRDALVTEREERRVSIWAGDANGSSLIEVAPPSRARAGPDVDWLGSRVLYSTFEGERRSLTVLDSNDAAIVDARQPASSANGGVTVFVATGARESGLWRRDDNGTLKLLLKDPSANHPTISPDGTRVVFISERKGVESLWVMSADGGEAVPLFDEFAVQPQISPDGQKILYASQTPTRQAIVVTRDFPSGANRETFPVGGGIWRWTPQGDGIAMRDEARRNIVVQPLDGSAPRQLTSFADREIDTFAFSRDGSKLAVARVTIARDIVLVRGLHRARD